jgi:hypothetical protein
MKGADFQELIRKYNQSVGYRCLFESLVDHEISPEDPLTETIKKGAQGVAYCFWHWNGNW